MMLQVSSSLSDLSAGKYLWVSRGCLMIRQACRWLRPYFCWAASTACRRRLRGSAAGCLVLMLCRH
jgi:hypothetical protein